jgi:hypothetical protein
MLGHRVTAIGFLSPATHDSVEPDRIRVSQRCRSITNPYTSLRKRCWRLPQAELQIGTTFVQSALLAFSQEHKGTAIESNRSYV